MGERDRTGARFSVLDRFSSRGPAIFRRRFDINRSLRIFVVTLAASVLVTGGAAYQSGDWDPAGIAWRSLVIALVVAAATAWTGGGRPNRSPAPAPRETTSAPRRPPRVGPRPAAEPPDSLEAQGITAKLLELIALGDRYGNTFSLALISVDGLADIRGEYGRGPAERLLDRVANALAHTLRMPDRLGRFESGVYLVVLPETAMPGAIQIAERLRSAVSELDIEVSPRVRIHTTASVGVTSFRRGDDLQGLLNRVQRTLRSAQEQGPNRVLPDLAA